MTDTNSQPSGGIMTIPGPNEPMPVPRPTLVDGVTPREDGRTDLIGLPKTRIAELFEAAGLDKKAAKLRAKQVYHWLYHRGVTEFEAMTDIAKTMRPWLAERFVVGRPEIVQAQHSSDGTRKWLLRTADNHDYEMVFIPDADRGTLCVSSQVGCTLNCRFCHTGTMRLVRNLTVGEIVGQVMLARDALGEWPKSASDTRLATMAGLDEDEDEGSYSADGRLLTNIVMMGMGEPLYNFDNVRDALKLVMDGDGLALSRRRITLSTSGVIPQIERCGQEISVNLAVSLHAVTKEVRDEIVPINKKYGIEDLLQACADYPGASNARRITFEYVMLKDKNDSDEDARELVRLLKKYKLPAKVNLIPFNPWPGAAYECSTPERIKSFSNIVFEAGISAPVRTPRGRDIDAACGQLKTAAKKMSRAEIDRLYAEKDKEVVEELAQLPE
ncbi:23S rRNA (adenine(2503)-C(2))-methyltransferase RlmN [Novosphingobium mangrovi (ex Hu et al. 2023)]|uniref:Dual-specificity RNA methyltransferase RlmN n=1 Tax=Novosphingobium mangrovi (ex Hu et al. 2023) TaxID=2930094 RepID=A0ABT0ABR1_9SPHN|nr:23S rRNA (adenine(2503)-C(2))-methyltransferase RlmN [Novosphingobium mangrovi (ex Hu et al. 2023)]MCJ1960633.1 23S rRNA (adenine(2503)-C(2))-methyltransferase RlmN [Novosphingobium mangrovi (ex Hu et al. 2023)]